MAFPIEAFLNDCTEQGRSKEFIDEAVSYINRIQSNGFPVIFSIEHLSIELRLPSNDVKFLIRSDTFNYTYFLLNKKLSAGKREIMAPMENLKFIQRWINYNILQKATFNTHIKGFIPETSTYKNAIVHESAKFLLKIDLLKFFDCISSKRVYGIFRSFGYSKNVAWDLTKICTTKHRRSYWASLNSYDREKLNEIISNDYAVLPQGAPTSPLLANLIASRLDKRISKLSEKLNFQYTRYADDLCISGNEKSNIPSINILTKIIEEEGFFVNPQKVKFSKAGMKQYVTGLSITNKVSISKNKRREIFTHLYFLRKYGLELHLQKLKSKGIYHTNFQNWLFGHISYHFSINQEIGKKMFSIYNLISWQIDADIAINETQ